MHIGAHISIARGYPAAVAYAVDVGCECMQVFAKSPRQWRGPATDPVAAEEFRRLREETDIGPLFTHTAYLLNLSTDDDVLWERSVDALADELARGSALGAAAVVTHIGNDRTVNLERVVSRVAEALGRTFDRVGHERGATRLLLENTAGAGTAVGASPAELGWIIEASALPSDTLGVCLDTCHAHAFGYDLSNTPGWDALLGEMAACVGLERLGLIHANDCKFDSGSKRDRHEWIGDGTIGVEGFTAMLCHPLLQHLPVVTEMPGEVPDKDVENLTRLKSLRADCVQQARSESPVVGDGAHSTIRPTPS
jgi:deoxyribonuclease-4